MSAQELLYLYLQAVMKIDEALQLLGLAPAHSAWRWQDPPTFQHWHATPEEVEQHRQEQQRQQVEEVPQQQGQAQQEQNQLHESKPEEKQMQGLEAGQVCLHNHTEARTQQQRFVECEPSQPQQQQQNGLSGTETQQMRESQQQQQNGLSGTETKQAAAEPQQQQQQQQKWVQIPGLGFSPVASLPAEQKPLGWAIDIGAAPGAWSSYLASTCCDHVIAVDPAALNPAAEALPNLHHVRLKGEEAVAAVLEILAGKKVRAASG